MNKVGVIAMIAAVLSLSVSPMLRAEEEITKTAKKVFAAHQDSVVWVSVVARMSVKTIGSVSAKANIPDADKKSESTGTIIDSSGLIVCSLASVDPSAAVDGQEISTSMGIIKLSASAKIKEVKIIMPDGTEVPADIVMKDTDLDLAFIRVRADSKEAKDVSFKAISIKDNTDGKVLDEVVALGRTGEAFGRQASVITSLVSAETLKPRHFLRVPTETVGGPVFGVSGKLIGITVLRHSKSESSSGSMQQLGLTPAVLPASDIATLLPQALKAMPAKSDAAATEDKAKPDDEKSDK